MKMNQCYASECSISDEEPNANALLKDFNESL
jgi:hypothetical protein